MGRADKSRKAEDVPSVANDGDGSAEYEGLGDGGGGGGGDDSGVGEPSTTFYSPSSASSSPRKKSCSSNCFNKSLIGLKALLFVFYGGIGVLSTWLNHVQISKRFTEKECLLVYGLSSILSLFTPFIFGFISDKSAQPKKVLAACLLIGGLLYPLILTVPPAAPHDYASRYERCAGSNNLNNGSFCLPSTFNCSTSFSEVISESGGCSEGCRTKLVLSECHFQCDSDSHSHSHSHGGAAVNHDYDNLPSPQAQIDRPSDSSSSGGTTGGDDEEGSEYFGPYEPTWLPHICINSHPHSRFSAEPLCYAFDEKMKNITLDVSGISGYADDDDDGKCHYPLLQYSERLHKFQHLLYCSPLSPNCHVSCRLLWDSDSDQWSCSSDFIQWAIAFGSFVAINTIGTMLVISAAGLLNAAILSMTHEHQGFYGCQLTYAVLGFALLTPSTAYLFEEYLDEIEIPWSLEYLGAYSLWLLLAALLTLTLPYHAEWVPKAGTIRPMLLRWTCRGHNMLFFFLLVILGTYQGLVDALGFFQAKHVGASLLQLGIGGAAAMIPALIFIYRVEKVIEFCGHHNILAISLVVFSLQFTGYAYLKNVIPEWSYLLKAMDTFSMVTVLTTAAHTTYSAAPRSLVGTCQAIIVTLYCCLGRGLGGGLGYVALLYLSRENVLKICAISSVVICLFYLMSHYCFLKPSPYNRRYDLDHTSSFGPSGKYTPLKIFKQKKDDKRSHLAHTASEDA